MARLVVQFPIEAKVKLNGAVRGETNRVIRLEAGEHLVELEGEATDPRQRAATVAAESDPDEIVRVAFTPAKKPIERFSPLYCRYNGFLLGQFLSLSFAKFGRELYPVRRARMLEFLSEVAVDIVLPEEPMDLGGDARRGWFSQAGEVQERRKDASISAQIRRLPNRIITDSMPP